MTLPFAQLLEALFFIRPRRSVLIPRLCCRPFNAPPVCFLSGSSDVPAGGADGAPTSPVTQAKISFGRGWMGLSVPLNIARASQPSPFAGGELEPGGSPCRWRKGGFGSRAKAVSRATNGIFGSTAVHPLSSGNRLQWVGSGSLYSGQGKGRL